MPRRNTVAPHPITELASLAGSFLRSLAAANRSPATIRAYGEALTRLDEFLAARGMPRSMAGLSREHIEAFVIDLLGRTKPASVVARYRALQVFFRWAVVEGEIERSPMERMKPPHVPETPPPVLAAHELRALLKACVGRDFEDRRDLALLMLLIDTGIRRAELAGLALADVDLEAGTITVLGKGARPRTIAYGRRAAAAIDRYVRSRRTHQHRDQASLWLGREGALTHWGIAQIVERRAKQAGVANANLHRFRHTAAHLWQAAEGSDNGAMQHFGWRSRQMLSRYGASAAAERARDEQRRISPADRL